VLNNCGGGGCGGYWRTMVMMCGAASPRPAGAYAFAESSPVCHD
jgi:hypothetical protein